MAAAKPISPILWFCAAVGSLLGCQSPATFYPPAPPAYAPPAHSQSYRAIPYTGERPAQADGGSGPLLVLQAAHVTVVPAAGHSKSAAESQWNPAASPQPHASSNDVDTSGSVYPIDLPTALRLAGAQNLDIHLARTLLSEAMARHQWASVLWYPTLRLGTEYIKHDGRLQETRGPVLEVSRNSGFIGGGLFAEFRLSDALYEPLAARQQATAAENRVASVTNEVLLSVTKAYFDLVAAEAQRLILEGIVREAKTVADLTRQFARTGQGLESDAARAEAELARRQAELAWATEQVRIASARLVRLLRLDPRLQLKPVNAPLAPLELVDVTHPLGELIDRALANRPEVQEQNALVQAALARLRQERMRAWLPDLNLGLSAGGYGGGEGSFFGNFSDRSDVTVGAFWSWRNLGAGEDAARRIQEARYQQASIAASQLADEIARQVSVAFHRVQQRRVQLEAARAAVRAAQQSLELNLRRIRGAEGLPIEALDALRTLADAQKTYIEAVTAYNQAQFELAWATGERVDELLQRSSLLQPPSN